VFKISNKPFSAFRAKKIVEFMIFFVSIRSRRLVAKHRVNTATVAAIDASQYGLAHNITTRF
jgi:hypothetical protein